jgi:rhamnogalacturonan endolyase
MTERAREVLWQDALSHATREAGAWPYAWMSDSNYLTASRRGTLNGEMVLHDPFAPNLKFSNMWVGLSAPEWTPKTSGLMGMDGFPDAVDWQRDAKFYQFWTRADTKGRFRLEHIRPGAYTLHAFTDGVLGEFVRSNIIVTASQQRSLGRLEWTPSRFGRTLWEIGVPDRTAREFRHGDLFWQWGLYFDYAKEFPNDVNFRIGASDWRKDWNYVQPPHLLSRDLATNGEENENNDNAAQALLSSPRHTAGSTTWSISFNLAKPARGTATLRLAFCGARNGCEVGVEVNGKSVASTGPLPPTGTMHRDGITGYWIEKDLSFDAALLQQGENRIRLISRASNWTQGVMYDYLRLELDDSAARWSAKLTP